MTVPAECDTIADAHTSASSYPFNPFILTPVTVLPEKLYPFLMRL